MQRVDTSVDVTKSVYVPSLTEAEVRKKVKREQRAVQLASKLERERKWQQAHRQRVSADRKALECADAFLRVGHSPGERTFTNDWQFWHGFTVNEDVRNRVDAKKQRNALHGCGCGGTGAWQATLKQRRSRMNRKIAEAKQLPKNSLKEQSKQGKFECKRIENVAKLNIKSPRTSDIPSRRKKQ